MKPLKVFFSAALGILLISFSVMAQEKPDEAYVYPLQIKGEVTYLPIQKDRPKRIVRRMEVIPSGVSLEIPEGASVSLTCPGCDVLTLTHRTSPYTVKMEDFKSEKTSMGETLKHFKAALKSMVFRGSKLGPKVHLVVRGSETPCDDAWPETGETILPIGSHMTFVWPVMGGFTLEIKELLSQEPMFSENLSFDTIQVPMDKFSPGKRYESTLTKDKIGRICSTSFTLLTKEDSSRIIKTLSDITSLLPDQADKDTRCGLQAGYLKSQGFKYNAWQWMRSSCL